MMPSTLKLFAISGLIACFSALTSARAIRKLQPRQGCPSLEPYDVNCELPFWTDHAMNLTFDDLSSSKPMSSYQSLAWSNFTIASPDTTRSHYIAPASSPNYLRLRAKKTAMVTYGDTAFFKIMSFYFACSFPSLSSKFGRPQNCTITMEAMCAGPESQSLLDVTLFTDTYDYVTNSDMVADMQYVNMGTNGEHWNCYNYTISAAAPDGGPAVLYMDEVEVVNYFESGLW